MDFLHFGSNEYWLGEYQRTGSGFNQTKFVASVPRQTFGAGASEGHGYFSESLQKFFWWGWIPSGPAPAEAGVNTWDSCLSVTREVSYEPGLSTIGEFSGMVSFYSVASLTQLRAGLLFESGDAWAGPPGGGEMDLPAAAGNCLDIELNVTWRNGTVPTSFGSLGVSVFGGTRVVISSGDAGEMSMNGVPLTPGGSSRARPGMLSLRVLVDRSVVEAFGQWGRASWAEMAFVDGTKTGLVWEPAGGGAEAENSPLFSVRVWKMSTGFVEEP
eukprot:TRINITY_DN48935_c0_g1_i1.p1 TRINITY_DN48935_c0_g1~~TRINITY_DN48935_c0_g1_i1.p1  ORF type:complete len:271 (-),score=44.39 TRINITY_DN48935_c0_g1_i1:313-1125(-)